MYKSPQSTPRQDQLLIQGCKANSHPCSVAFMAPSANGLRRILLPMLRRRRQYIYKYPVQVLGVFQWTYTPLYIRICALLEVHLLGVV